MGCCSNRDWGPAGARARKLVGALVPCYFKLAKKEGGAKCN
jgi:hypothetical protein